MIGIIDLVMGPVLTLVIFDPAKPKPALARDIGAITLMQVAALIYGLNTAFEARPVWLAFEADAFRLVTAADIPKADLTNAPEGMRQLSWRGPLPVGVPSLTPNDPGYLLSIEQSIAGFHSAFRPARWVAYSTQIEHVKKQAKPLSELSRKNSFHAEIITRTIKQLGVNESELAYLPLITREQNDWVVIINKIDGRPLTTLPMDGW